MRIRDARGADARAIARVHVDAWRNAYAGLLPDRMLARMSGRVHAARWEATLRQRGRDERVLVAELDRAGVVGYGNCGPSRVRSLPHAGEVYELYVAPEYQERGIGRRLLQRLFDRLVEAGADSAVVWVLAANPARFFYETMGGRRVAERDEALWNVVLPQAAYGWDDLKAIRAGQAPLRRGSGLGPPPR
ncbi:MAG: GNAT family N-acetyltransferase [Rhodospirillales bacterium]